MTEKFIPSRISVVMPCYNAAAFVEEAVNSVMSQTYSNVELIVIDDGSTDGSAEILERLSDHHNPRVIVLSQDHLGPYAARNRGLEQARGELVAFLDADDYWVREALAKLAAAIEGHGADLAYCGWQNIGCGAPGIDPFIPPDYGKMDTIAEFLRSCPWPIHAVLVRRAVLDAVHGFSERCFSAMDYDLWLRIYRHTQKIVRVPVVMAYYRWHDKGQISKIKWKQVLDAFRVRREFVAQNPERIAHLPKETVFELSGGYLLREAYHAYWARNLADAQMLFRHAFFKGLWKIRDIKYLLLALLPQAWFKWLVAEWDNRNTRHL